MTLSPTQDLRKGTRVALTVDRRGVPEGTTGRVGRRLGLDLARYRVAFDNGLEVTSVVHDDLVLADEWDEFVRVREEQAEAAASGSADDGGDATVGEGGGADATDGDGGGGGAADDRLAALLAKSKAARAAKEG